MKKLLTWGIVCLALLALSGDALAYSGGPDIFGHVWKDNDEPGGPAFNYIDISGTGTLLGTGDDVAFGPIQLGFVFPFYRGEYESLWVNTNGFITLTERTTTRSNYCPVPGTGREYWIAPFWDDLDVRADSGGAVYYQYFDATVDYLVIQWHNFLRRSEPGTPMDMEAILYQNGVIVFQYDAINTTARGQGQEATVGIQDDSTDGLSSLCNGLPVEHLLHHRLAIGWYPPTIDHDIRAVSLDSPTADLAVVGGHLNVTATFRNMGNYAENFNAYLEIRDSGNMLVHSTSTAMSLAAGASGQAVFPAWTIPSADDFALSVRAGLSGDQRPYNDSLNGALKTVNSVTLPLSQDFEGTFPPEGWTVFNLGGEEPWRTNTTHYRSATHSAWASYDWIVNANDWLVMAPINMTLASNVTWYFYEDQSGWAEDGLRHTMYVSTGEFFDLDTAAPVAIHTPIDHTIAGFNGNPVSIDLSAYAGNSCVWLAYRLENLSGLGVEHWWVDDVTVINLPDTDIGVLGINSPMGGIRPNCDAPIRATVKNYGLQAQMFDVGISITGATHGLIYTDTITGVNLVPSGQNTLEFDNFEDPLEDDYTLTVTVLLPTDENPSNNTLSGLFYVSTIIEHIWDDDHGEYSYVPFPFNNAMAAVKYTPFSDDFTIVGGSIYIRDHSADSTSYAEFEWVAICPDLGGYPDLSNPYALVPNIGVYDVPTLLTIDVPDVVVTDYFGDIWIVAKYADGLTHFLAIGDDSTMPDGKSYSNTAGDPPVWVQETEHDYMMRLQVQYAPCSGVTLCNYRPGDINGNGTTNGIDVGYGVNYFKGGPVPPVNCSSPIGPCPQASPFFAAGDINGNCVFNGIDVTYFVNYLKGIVPALLYCPTCPPAAPAPPSPANIPVPSPELRAVPEAIIR